MQFYVGVYTCVIKCDNKFYIPKFQIFQLYIHQTLVLLLSCVTEKSGL